MGRGYAVEQAVEGYLSKLGATHACPVSGLLIGQSSSQRDYVIMASRTPPREGSASTAGKSLDKEWVAEHARQVSRMLPGGLAVLGVFMISDADAKDTVATLSQLVFAVENLISSEYLWNPADDDITDCVTLHVNPKTRKYPFAYYYYYYYCMWLILYPHLRTICRTFDVKNPKSMAKLADWKYHSGVCSSWSMVSCCVNVDMLVPLPGNGSAAEILDAFLKEGLKEWARQIQHGICLFEGKTLPDDTELLAGQKRNRQTFTVQLLISPDDQSLSDVVQQCGGSVSVRGAIHSRAYLHSNKSKVRLAEKLLKRDVLSTVAARVQMLLEELLMSEEGEGGGEGGSRGKHQTAADTFALPRRIFCPVSSCGPVCVCDYQFSDEAKAEATDRLKEMLDIDVAEEHLDTSQESPAQILERGAAAELTVGPVEALEPKRSKCVGVAMATAVALLATAASMLYLSDI
ncbi:protein odr-4 homolog isoform X1 [Brachionichthys hirsutus]|uniref:protein odr-4 homolog isoform X1 n=1 Tax=Brachionichthys hirsutus TaxID=412623 RepID=UPI003604AD33